ncbi:MAG: type IV pilus twitching motility protein PilT [Bacillota bacterium]|nr:type IV pilus twitching motility protein PilT [Bacillota bacterium]MDW7677957.1 type IV pilus twitching motility protein PilT [Bacillota bacterium]
MDILEYLKQAVDAKASDLHITVGLPPIVRIDGSLERLDDERLTPQDSAGLVTQVLTEQQLGRLQEKGELDFSFSNPGMGRFRVNAYRQRGSYGMAFRVVQDRIPSLEELGLPAVVADFTRKQRGLVLVTGPTGSGKSTSLASMIDLINHERNCHVITLEDPIEYLHKHNKCVINQREVGDDTQTFANGLRAALRQDPDVILVGEMRDLETIATAVTAAETGHLVFSTVHTIGAANTVDRIIDVFPPHQQEQIKVQLSSVLEGIISQQLMAKKLEKGRVAAFEIMTATPAIRNLVREGKTHQIQSAVQTGAKHGMVTMDAALLNHYRNGTISRETCITYAQDHAFVMKQLSMMI